MVKHRFEIASLLLIFFVITLANASDRFENSKPVFTLDTKEAQQKPTVSVENLSENVRATTASVAVKKSTKSTLEQAQSLNDKLQKPESADTSINTNNHGEMMNSNVDNNRHNKIADGSADDDGDRNERNKGEINERKNHNSNDSSTTPDTTSSTTAKVMVTKDEEQLPVKPLLSWDYTVNDAFDDDELYSRTFSELYDIGVEAYLENNWRDCITYLETALHEFRVFRHGLINCRIQCSFEMERTAPFFDTNIEQMQFFDLTTRRALCLGKCHNKLLRKQYLPPFYLHRAYRDRFVNKKPYEYLQLCYYKDEEYEKAASATYTVLMHDPGNSLMLSNMRYYLSERKVDTSNIKDLEEQPYAQLFVDAIDAYNEEEFQKATQFFEESLFQYILAEDECRAFCEGEFDHGQWYPDFIIAIANHYTFNLYCKQNCTRELSNIKGEVYPNVMATHYEYLQLSYYKVNDIEKACRAIGSFLLFYPENEDMLANIKYYKEEYSVPDSYFKPRSEAKQYHDRQIYERKIFSNFIEEYAKISKQEKARKRPRKRSVDGGLVAEFSSLGTDAFGNGACIIKKSINLFKDSVLQLN